MSIKLKIIPGQFVSIIGPNGSGKTTLLKKLVRKYRRAVAVAPQIFLVDLEQTVERYLKRFSKQAKEIQKLLKELKILDKNDLLLKKLSGGELQRVLIVQVLLQNKPILILDEPVNHLDPHLRTKILRMLKKTKKTIITVMHDQRDAYRFSDRIYVMDNGKIASVLK